MQRPTVLLPEDPIEAKACVDRLDERVQARGDVFPLLSVSIGIAEYHWDNPCPIETLIQRADAAMYRQKLRKRDACV